MKKLILSIFFASVLCIGAFAADIVYVNGFSGADTGAGTSASPYATLQKALDTVASGGKIILTGDVTLKNGEELKSKKKSSW